jgi:hypothetical protein
MLSERRKKKKVQSSLQIGTCGDEMAGDEIVEAPHITASHCIFTGQSHWSNWRMVPNIFASFAGLDSVGKHFLNLYVHESYGTSNQTGNTLYRGQHGNVNVNDDKRVEIISARRM